MHNNSKLALLAFAISFVVLNTSCAESESGDVLANVATLEGVQIEFVRLADGQVAVSEVGSGDLPSRLTELAAQGATPLEIFLAVAPDAYVPPELETHHALVTGDAPRDLSVTFRHSYSGEVYSTNCTRYSDQSWFSSTYQGTGWGHQAYWSGNASYHDADFTTQHSITHVCNYSEQSGSEPLVFTIGLWGSNTVQYWLEADIGQRAIIYVVGSSTEHWWSAVSHWYDSPSPYQTNTFRHGVMYP